MPAHMSYSLPILCSSKERSFLFSVSFVCNKKWIAREGFVAQVHFAPKSAAFPHNVIPNRMLKSRKRALFVLPTDILSAFHFAKNEK